MSDDTEEPGRWMTYGEIAQMRGIDRYSAIRLVRRNHWRKSKNNLGELIVLVPTDQRMSSEETSPDVPQDKADESISRIAAAFESALATLQSQFEQQRARADAAETALADARQQIGREQGRAEAAEGRAVVLDARLTAATEAARTAEAEVIRWRITADDLAALKPRIEEAAEVEKQARARAEAAETRMAAIWPWSWWAEWWAGLLQRRPG